MVFIACSKLEKLRARLLAIGQRRATPEQDTAADCDQTEGNGQIYICQEMFSLLQEQLKEYVAYHHLILEDRQFSVFLFSNNYVLCSVSSKKVWILELTRKHNSMQLNFQHFICYCLLCPFILIYQYVTA